MPVLICAKAISIACAIALKSSYFTGNNASLERQSESPFLGRSITINLQHARCYKSLNPQGRTGSFVVSLSSHGFLKICGRMHMFICQPKSGTRSSKDRRFFRVRFSWRVGAQGIAPLLVLITTGDLFARYVPWHRNQVLACSVSRGISSMSRYLSAVMRECSYAKKLVPARSIKQVFEG